MNDNSFDSQIPWHLDMFSWEKHDAYMYQWSYPAMHETHWKMTAVTMDGDMTTVTGMSHGTGGQSTKDAGLVLPTSTDAQRWSSIWSHRLLTTGLNP